MCQVRGHVHTVKASGPRPHQDELGVARSTEHPEVAHQDHDGGEDGVRANGQAGRRDKVLEVPIRILLEKARPGTATPAPAYRTGSSGRAPLYRQLMAPAATNAKGISKPTMGRRVP